MRVCNGRCTRCDPDHLFIGMTLSEYNHAVTRHAQEHHNGTDPREYVEKL